MAVKPIENYLLDYALWLMKSHPGPRWAMRDAVRRNLVLWHREYGEAVANKVRQALNNEKAKGQGT